MAIIGRNKMAKQYIPADERAIGMGVGIDLRCGDCRFFKSESVFKHPCKELGDTEENLACPYFQVNLSKLNMSKDESLAMSEALQAAARLSPRLVTYMAPILRGVLKTKKAGLELGQVVWVQAVGNPAKPYVNNYVRAWVVYADKHTVELKGLKGTTFKLKPSSVLVAEAWKKKKKFLIKKKRLNDPKNHFKVEVDDVEPFIGPETEIGEHVTTLNKKSALKVKTTVVIRDSEQIEREALDMGEDTDE